MTVLEASLLASVLTGFFTLAGAYASNILQRSLGQDERMWSRRAETYVALLQYQGSGMVEGQIEAATAPEWAVRDELTAKARAFASNEVLDLWQKSALANLQVQGYAEENHPGTTSSPWSWAAEDDAAKDPEMQRLRQASEQAAKQLAARIRTELDVDRRRHWWQFRQGQPQPSLPPSGPALRGPDSLAKPSSETPLG